MRIKEFLDVTGTILFLAFAFALIVIVRGGDYPFYKSAGIGASIGLYIGVTFIHPIYLESNIITKNIILISITIVLGYVINYLSVFQITHFTFIVSVVFGLFAANWTKIIDRWND